jgi:hypothetical protein
MIRSSGDPELSLTALNAAASPESLAAGLKWWPVGLLLAVVYSVFFSGRIAARCIRFMADEKVYTPGRQNPHPQVGHISHCHG